MDDYFPERVLAIGCLRNPIASKLHSSPDELANLRFIVNDEYMSITVRHAMPSWRPLGKDFPCRSFGASRTSHTLDMVSDAKHNSGREISGQHLLAVRLSADQILPNGL